MLECIHTAVYTEKLILLQVENQMSDTQLRITTFIQHMYHRTTCNYSAFLHSWGQQPNFLYLLVQSKALHLSLSNPGKM